MSTVIVQHEEIVINIHAGDSGLADLHVSNGDGSYSDTLEMPVADALFFAKQCVEDPMGPRGHVRVCWGEEVQHMEGTVSEEDM